MVYAVALLVAALWLALTFWWGRVAYEAGQADGWIRGRDQAIRSLSSLEGVKNDKSE